MDKEIREKAEKWSETHSPFFAVDVEFGISAFTAGYQQAMKDYEK